MKKERLKFARRIPSRKRSVKVSRKRGVDVEKEEVNKVKVS